MKKFFIVFFLALASTALNAQSFQIHQSYNTPKDDFTSYGYTSTRFLADYFWTSDSGKWNIFSWNSFDTGVNVNLLLYGEREIGNTGLYGHLETRYNSYGKGTSMDGSVQAGLAYLIPWEKGVSIYLTPKYFGGYVVGEKDWVNDVMFSINTSYETKHFYYEGYIDTRWVNNYSCFFEQKAYYKITDVFQLGACVVFTASTRYDGTNSYAYAQPYLSLRVSLY